MTNRINFKIWLIWLIPMCFCMFQFILRLFPGNVQTELMTNFNISATEFGTFSAAYYLGYAGMQIPIAIFIEKYGPRLVVTLSALTCALGCFIMFNTNSWLVATFSRFLIGSGSVVGLLGTTKVIIDWFPVQHHAKMIGFSMSVGLVGALYGGKPISLLIQEFNWQQVLFALAIASSILSLLAFLLIRDAKHDSKYDKNTNYSAWFKQIINLLRNKHFLTLAIANFLMVGSLEGFADVWGINYLTMIAQINKPDAALIASFIFLGMLIGTPFLSALADYTKAHYKVTSMCGLLMSVSLAYLLINPTSFTIFGLKILMLFIGVLSGYQAIVFVIGERSVTKNLSNTVIATLNSINMFGGVFFHKTIGVIMDLSSVNYSYNYNLTAYSYGLAIIPAMALLGGLMLLTLKKKQK